MFSNTLSLLSSRNVNDQVSHPYKTKGKIIVLNISIFEFLDRNLTMTPITLLYPQTEYTSNQWTFHQRRLIKTHNTHWTPWLWNTTYVSRADEVVTLSDDINKTDNIVRMEEEQCFVPTRHTRNIPQMQRSGLTLLPPNQTPNVSMTNRKIKAKNQNRQKINTKQWQRF